MSVSIIEVVSYKGRRSHVHWLAVLPGLFLAGLLLFAALLGRCILGAHDVIQGDPGAMVVLGCQVKSWGPSVLLQDRLDRAADYWKEHPDILVVVSGGQGPDESEAEARAMANYLISCGVPEKQIRVEEDSHNTNQNIRFSLELLEQEGYDTDSGILVVSSGFHLVRVRMLWGRICGGTEELSTLAAPASHLPSRVKMYFREPFALVKSFVFDR